METATLINLRILDFWELTPFEFNLMINAYVTKNKQLRDDQITLAYLVAYWGRVKTMPNLSELLESGQSKKKAQQSPEQMLAIIKAMNASMGGDVV